MQFDEIKKIHQQGKLAEAKAGYLAILKANPEHVEALHFYAILLAEEEDFVKARQHLEKAIELAPTQFSLRLNLANIYKSQGMLHDAEQLLQEVINLSPNYAPAINNLGTIYYAEGQWQQAIDAYQKAIDIQPDYADAYYNLGLAYIKARQPREAMNVFNALLTLVPTHGGAGFQRASLIMQQGNYQLAAEQFLRLAETFPHHFETLSNLANCYLKMGKLELAKKYSLLALDLIPADAQLLFNMGVINMQLGLVNEAISYYQLCLQVSPDNIEAHTNLGAAFLEIKDKQSASQHLREVVRLRPDDVAVKHTLAIISGEQPMHAAPANYIQTLFDSYADHYDKHVQEKLKYQVPELMHELLKKSDIVENKKLSILDIGCGTGLCGVELAGYAETITGVDLSANMLELATSRKCYTTLVKSDIIEFLNKDKEKYDLIVAGDTVVYFANLNELFLKVHEHLNANGIFVFNIEKSMSDDIVPAAGRFLHSADYISKLAKASHFEMLQFKEVTLRQQEVKPVAGILYLLRCQDA